MVRFGDIEGFGIRDSRRGYGERMYGWECERCGIYHGYEDRVVCGNSIMMCMRGRVGWFGDEQKDDDDAYDDTTRKAGIKSGISVHFHADENDAEFRRQWLLRRYRVEVLSSSSWSSRSHYESRGRRCRVVRE